MLYGILTCAGSSNRCASKDNNEEAIFHNPGKFHLNFCMYYWLLKKVIQSLVSECNIFRWFQETVQLTSCFVYWQWEALALLLIGISVNQLKSLPEGSSALGLPVAAGAYLYTLFFVSSDFLVAGMMYMLKQCKTHLPWSCEYQFNFSTHSDFSAEPFSCIYSSSMLFLQSVDCSIVLHLRWTFFLKPSALNVSCSYNKFCNHSTSLLSIRSYKDWGSFSPKFQHVQLNDSELVLCGKTIGSKHSLTHLLVYMLHIETICVFLLI
jgi:hypothetical protein